MMIVALLSINLFLKQATNTRAILGVYTEVL